MADQPAPPYHQLMYGLLYPGVLGTGIVLTGVRAAHDLSLSHALLDPAIHVAVTATVFFMASFVSAFYWPPPSAHAAHIPGYSKGAFVFDLAEIVLMFICFQCVGLFELPEIVAPRLLPAYTALAIDVLLQLPWRWAAGIADWYKLWPLRCLVVAILMAGGFFGAQTSVITISILVFVVVFVVYYISRDPRYQ